MIEEAAGTRMYEAKKAGAQKIIEKKDAKLKEIETVCCFCDNMKGTTKLQIPDQVSSPVKSK